MVMGWETASDGAPSWVMAARPRTRKSTPRCVMRTARRLARRGVVVVAAASILGLLAGLGVAAPAIAAPQARASSAARSQAAAAPGTQLWAERYNGPANAGDSARSVSVNHSRTTVFVTGVSASTATGPDYATTAYDAVTGARLWVKRYNGPADRADEADWVAVAPGGGTVYVTGVSRGVTSGTDYATIAYDAATGAQLWAARYNGPANGGANASAVAVSPDGATVFVTGFSKRTLTTRRGNTDYATVAYDAATGARLWVARYNGPGKREDTAASLAVSPAGRTVFVTGTSTGFSSGGDSATVAYNAATGKQLWVRRYNGPANSYDSASSLAVGLRGKKVFVTGQSYGGFRSLSDYATIAYDAATGQQLWVRRYNGPGHSIDDAYSVAVSPAGKKVFVTGDSATIAYNTATGTRLWATRDNPCGTRPADKVSMPSARPAARYSPPAGATALPRKPTRPPLPTTPVPERSCGQTCTTARQTAMTSPTRWPSAPLRAPSS
jgi:PQQ-like domain